MPLAAFAAGLLQDGAYYLFALKPKCVKYFKYHKISRTARTDLTLAQYPSSAGQPLQCGSTTKAYAA